MTENLPFSVLPGQEEKLLTFLNQISTPEELYKRTGLKDDDSIYDQTGEHLIGEKVALSILEGRSKLKSEKFINLQQLLDLSEVDPDTIKDLIKYLWTPAAKFFKSSMFKNVVLDNWKIEFWSKSFVHQEDVFEEIATDKYKLRQYIAQKVYEIVNTKQENPVIASLAKALIQQSYIERYEDHISGSNLFALWWHRFDPENWFSYKKVLSQTEAYFSYYTYYQNRLELFMVKDFINEGTLSEAVTTIDLPVVVNYGERAITIWAASVFD